MNRLGMVMMLEGGLMMWDLVANSPHCIIKGSQRLERFEFEAPFS